MLLIIIIVMIIIFFFFIMLLMCFFVCFTVTYACVGFIFHLPMTSHKYYLEVKSPLRFESLYKNIFFFVFLTFHLGTIRVNNQLDALFNVFISLLYMFRATKYSSSGESIVPIHHLVYITLCRWPSGMQVRDQSWLLTRIIKKQL